MMKRSMSIGFSTLLILSVIIVIDVVPVSANDPVWNVDHWETTGDWVIDATTTTFLYTSDTIRVNGNLTVTSGFTLTLQNVVLEMNVTGDGQYNITVNSGGSLIIEDLDDDHTTTTDASIITNSAPINDYRYGFVVEGPSGYLELKNSELHECGWDNSDPDWKDAGLNIQGQNAIITGNDLSGNFRGLIFHNTDAQGAKIENNTIHDNQATGLWISSGSTNNHIANNEIYNNEFGIFINSSVNSQVNYIINNNIYSNSLHGIFLEDSSKLHINNNDIHDNSLYGIFVDSSSDINILVNDIYDNTQVGIYIQDSSNMQINNNGILDNNIIGIRVVSCSNLNIEGNDILNHTGSTGIQLWNSQMITVYNNLLDSNGGSGGNDFDASIYSENSTGVIINNNQILNSNYFGMFIQDQPDIVVENNRVENTLALASVLVFYDISSYGLINNNTVLNSGFHAIFVDSCYNMKVTNNTIDDVNYDGGVGIVNQRNEITSTLKVYIYNNIIRNIGTGNEGVGMTLISGSDHVVDGNTLSTITSHGMVIDVSDSTIKNNIITNVGTSLSATNFNDVSGLALAGNQNTLINNTIEDCQAPAGNPVSGLQFGYQGGSFARNTVIKDSYFYGNEINIRAEETSGSITNVIIENSTLGQDGDTQYDFYLNNDAHLTTLNSTFDNTSVNIVDADSDLTVKWYLNVNVKDGGVGYNGAEVYVQNLFGEDEPALQPMITQTIDFQQGWVKWIPLTEFVMDSSTRTDYTNHWVNVSAGSKGGLSIPNMWMSHSIIIDLNDIPEVINLKRGMNSVYRADTVYLFVNASDAETSEGQLDPIFEYREPNDYGWNTSHFGVEIWDVAGFWKIPFTPPIEVPLGYYDIRGRVQDEYGLYSPWTTYLNASGVDVKNNPPYVEDMYNINFTTAPEGSIYRGDHAWIYGDGEDVEDGDDENFQTAQFQYKRPGKAWNDTISYWKPYSPTTGDGNWYQNFEPDAMIDTPVGVYQFRVRFLDTDADWSQWVNLEELNVLNYPPQFNGFSKQSGSVLRGNSVTVFANVQDREETPGDLEVHFYYKHALDTIWDDTWFITNGQLSGQDHYADFNPPNSATLGLYEFRVDITDHNSSTEDGATISVYPPGTAINVMNNIPTTIDVKMSSGEVRANVETIFVHVNATDIENVEQLLKVFKIEWRENNSVSQDPPADPWHIDSTKLNINLDEGYAPAGYIRASISPSASAYLGDYDIRVSVVDVDGDDNNWWYLHNAFKIVNPEPTLIDITLQKAEVFRGNTIYITLNASDLGQSESDLTVDFQYKMKTDSIWTTFSVSSDYYNPSGGGFWKIPFSPGLDWDDDKLGSYEFQGRVKNDANAYSDRGAFRKATGSVEVKNNVPEALLLGTDTSIVERSSTIVIYAEGDDMETSQDDLIVIFEYSSDSGATWDALSNEDYNNGQSRWEVDFTPESDDKLGIYDFRVRFFDDEDYSDYIEQQDLVEVTNAVPVVISFSISDDTAYRMDSITLTAEVSDADQDIETLTPNFQYQGPNDSNWIGQSGSNYFGSASIDNGKWVITFTAPADADVGDYNFRVEFTDSAGDTSEINAASELIGELTLENSQPEVTIDSPSPGSKSPGKLKFEATAYDQESLDLTWLWTFGDGETSAEESPSHEYTEPGDYKITVTVTDSDGSSIEDEITITIKGEPKGDSMTMILLILVLVIVVVLVLVLLLAKKKKKPEAAAPPEYDPTAQPAEIPQAPAEQPPVQPGDQPIPEPAAPAASVAAATPMAAPADTPAGQMIKCPKCATPFPVTSTERPLTIECPHCGAKGTLK